MLQLRCIMVMGPKVNFSGWPWWEAGTERHIFIWYATAVSFCLIIPFKYFAMKNFVIHLQHIVLVHLI